MRETDKASTNLWAVMVSYGLEEEFDHDWLGRIRHNRTKRYLRIDANPEFLDAIATAQQALSLAGKGAVGALTKARETIRRRLLTSRA